MRLLPLSREVSRMSRPARSFVFVLLLLAGACVDGPKGGDEVGGARTEIVDPGKGPENVEPLWPLVVGERREQHAGVVAVPDRTRKFGKTLYRFQGASTVRFYDKTDEGIFSAGSINLGALPRAVLLVPAKVKVGLKWRSYVTGDLPSITSVVKSAELKDTIFGKRLVWTIEQTDEVGGTTYSTSFAEGRGPVEVDGDVALSSIVPLDPEPEFVTNERLALTPLNGGLPLFPNFWATQMSAIVDASGQATIRTGGIMTSYKNTGFGASWVLAPQTACASSSDGTTLQPGGSWAATGDGSKATSPACPDASGALFVDGVLQQIDVGADGSHTDGHTGLHVMSNGMTESFEVSLDQEGLTILGLGTNNQLYGLKTRVYGGEIARSWAAAAGAFQRILIDSTAPSDDFGFAAMFGDRVVAGAVKGTSITPLELVAGVPGAHLSTKTTPSGREHYLVTADGVVDRLHIGTDGTVTLDRYAELDLPAQHELVGVIPFSDHLLVLALHGREEIQPGGFKEPILGDVLAFSAPLPSAVDDPGRAMLPHNAITTEFLDEDLKVCWRKGAGAASTKGWTLGGEPVTAIVGGASGDCVVLLRAKSALPREVPLGEGAYAVEGRIPGVGQVAIGIHTPENNPNLPYGAPNQIAPLAGGGFTSVALRYGNAADVIGIPANPTYVTAATSGLADVAGNGLWWPNSGATRHICLHENPAFILTGPTTRCIDVPSTSFPVGIIGGGGALWQPDLVTPPVLVKPDGTATTIVGLPTGAVVRGGLADGTVCGTNGTAGARTLFCVREGVVTTGPIIDSQYGFLQGSWAPAGSVFYSLSANMPSRINPETMTVEALDRTAQPSSDGYYRTHFSSDGQLFAAHHEGDATHLYAVEGTTLIAADPVGYAPFATRVLDVVITKDLVVGFSSSGGILRFPRK